MRLLPLIAFCLLMSCREAPPANSPQVSTTQSSDVEAREAVEPKLRGIVRNPNFDEKITPEVQQIVVDFMEQWFAAQADLSQPDFFNLFDKTTLQGREALAFNEMILSCLTEIRSSRPNDLTFSDTERHGTGVRKQTAKLNMLFALANLIWAAWPYLAV